jgi:uncharacterized protein (TIGR00369 family)
LIDQVDNRKPLFSTAHMSHPLEQNPAPGSLLAGIPHAAALGLRIVKIESGKVTCHVPFAEALVGNPDTRVIHGGVITALLDNACGIAVGTKTMLRGQIATLDLRIDYMRAATPDQDILAIAECFKVTRNIAFARGLAYHTDPNDPIATCAAAFMLGTKSAPGPDNTAGNP